MAELNKDDLAKSIGRGIRRVRQERGLTLKEFGDQTGLSGPFLSQLENGRAMPSIVTLHRAAEVLGTTAQALLAGDDAEPVSVVRAGEGRTFDFGDGGASVRFVMRASHRMEVTETVAQPGFEQSEFMEHVGDDMIYVLRGEVEVEIRDQKTERLSAGDAIGYPSTIPHRWRVVSDEPAEFLFVSAPATF
ncbi:MAG: cupin domain-containing protein [Acidimicrobiia bacterium]|nr:cupin domain-containing protein [Acidimicrobiia bacterium]